MPTFARPLNASSAASAPAKMPYAVTVVSLVTLSCAALFLVARPDGAQNLPVNKLTSIDQKIVSTSKPGKESAQTSAADHQGLGFYSDNVRGGMFSQPVPAPEKPAVVHREPAPKPAPPVPLPKIDPFAFWTYTGTLHMGDVTMALLENKQTHEGMYVKNGDKIMGATVKSVDDQMVTINGSDKKPTMLSKSDMVVITPLNQDAPGKNPAQQAPQNGQPNPAAQAQNGQQQNAANQFTAMGPNGQMISGDRAQRYQQRLDRGWNGGGGGNNGGGFGGRGGGSGQTGGGGGSRRGGRGGFGG